MFLNHLLLGESLDQLTDRLDTAGTTVTRWAGVAPALGRAATTAELIALLHRDDTGSADRRERMDGGDELLAGLLHNIGKVVTLGTPFSGDPRANNAWRLYIATAGPFRQ